MSDPRESRLTPDVPDIGTTLVGKYRIEKILGRGGMGVVAAATHLKLGQRVAIKFLLQPEHEEAVARFLREARAAVRLRSEHVARVLDVGQLETGSPYMVMEYLEGNDLLRHVRTNGPLNVTDAVLYVLQTCEAIAEAHAAGIIHRDLKPANLFLTTTADGEACVKVLDFGISKTTEKADDGGQAFSLTKLDDVLGSPLYMPPEQLKSSKNVDVRSDIWAIGVILYQLLTGKTPWSSNVMHELVMGISMDPPPPVGEFRQDVPAGLEAVMAKCLEKKREHRFGNVAELAWALVEFGPPHAEQSAKRASRLLEAAGVSVQSPARDSMRAAALSAPTLPSVVAPRQTAHAATVESTISTESSLLTVFKTSRDHKHRRSYTFGFLAAVALLAAGGSAWYLTHQSTSTSRTPESLPTRTAANERAPASDGDAQVRQDSESAVPATSASVPLPLEPSAVRPDGPAPKTPTMTKPPTQGGTNVKGESQATQKNHSAPNAQETSPASAKLAPNTQPSTPENPLLKLNGSVK